MGAATSKRRGGSAAAVLDFAVAQILGDDTALGALPAVLARMVEAFGLRAALAFQPSGGQPSGGQPPGEAGARRRSGPPCWRCTRRERWTWRCWPGSAWSPRRRGT